MLTSAGADYPHFCILLGTYISFCALYLRNRTLRPVVFFWGNAPVPRDSGGELPCCPGTRAAGGRAEANSDSTAAAGN